MARLLFLQASPRSERSFSLRVAETFVEAYCRRRPGDIVLRRDLFAPDLPPFDLPAVNGKYALLHGQPCPSEDREAWTAVEAVIEEFTSADKYLFAVPMWNFGIPYRLKQYFDLIVQPGYTFSYDPETGYRGLVPGKPVLAVYARGGEHGEPSEMDFQKRYVETILGFMGLTLVRSIVVEPTLQGGSDLAQERLDAALAEARRIAQDF